MSSPTWRRSRKGASPIIAVEHVNDDSIATQIRLLCRLRAPWPDGYVPFSGLRLSDADRPQLRMLRPSGWCRELLRPAAPRRAAPRRELPRLGGPGPLTQADAIRADPGWRACPSRGADGQRQDGQRQDKYGTNSGMRPDMRRAIPPGMAPDLDFCLEAASGIEPLYRALQALA